MIFNALIRCPSAIYQNWFKRVRPQVGGTVSGVYFELQGRHYVAADLTADQVDALRDNPHVIIEILSAPNLPLAIVPDAPLEAVPGPVAPPVAETAPEAPMACPMPPSKPAAVGPAAVAVEALEAMAATPLAPKKHPGRPKKHS